MVERLLRQAEWHHGFAQLWRNARRAAEKGSKSGKIPRAVMAVLRLEGELGKSPSVLDRTPEQLDQLDQLLERELRWLGLAVDGAPAIEEPHEEQGVTKVDWDASPFSFTGWATLDGESYGQLTKSAGRGANRLGWRDVKIELRSIRAGDVFWSGVSLGLACLVYGQAKYGETWGSTSDMIAAFLAGAGGVVVVQWASLPIFQSARERLSQGDESDEVPADNGRPAGQPQPSV